MLKSGDVICFSGRGFVSDAINLATFGIPRRGISHVGIISTYNGDQLLYESTSFGRPPCYWTGRKISGFQAHRMVDVLDFADCPVWVLPLRRPLYNDESDRLANFLDGRIGFPYDRLGAARSAGFAFRLLESMLHREDLSSVFCSEVVAAALSYIGVLNITSAGKYNPNALCRTLRRRGICGDWKRLR